MRYPVYALAGVMGGLVMWRLMEVALMGIALFALVGAGVSVTGAAGLRLAQRHPGRWARVVAALTPAAWVVCALLWVLMP